MASTLPFSYNTNQNTLSSAKDFQKGLTFGLEVTGGLGSMKSSLSRENSVFRAGEGRSDAELVSLLKSLSHRKKEALRWRKTLAEFETVLNQLAAKDAPVYPQVEAQVREKFREDLIRVEMDFKKQLRDVSEAKKREEIELLEAKDRYMALQRVQSKAEEEERARLEEKMKASLKNDLEMLKNSRQAAFETKEGLKKQLGDKIEESRLAVGKLSRQLGKAIEEKDTLFQEQSAKIGEELLRIRSREISRAEEDYKARFRDVRERLDAVSKDSASLAEERSRKLGSNLADFEAWKANQREKLLSELRVSEAEVKEGLAVKARALQEGLAQTDDEISQVEAEIAAKTKIYEQENRRQISRVRQEFSSEVESLTFELGQAKSKVQLLKEQISGKKIAKNELARQVLLDRGQKVEEIQKEIEACSYFELRDALVGKIDILEAQIEFGNRRKGKRNGPGLLELEKMNLEKAEILANLRALKADVNALVLASDSRAMAEVKRRYAQLPPLLPPEMESISGEILSEHLQDMAFDLHASPSIIRKRNEAHWEDKGAEVSLGWGDSISEQSAAFNERIEREMLG